jgi:hypothetical protein
MSHFMLGAMTMIVAGAVINAAYCAMTVFVFGARSKRKGNLIASFLGITVACLVLLSLAWLLDIFNPSFPSWMPW